MHPTFTKKTFGHLDTYYALTTAMQFSPSLLLVLCATCKRHNGTNRNRHAHTYTHTHASHSQQPCTPPPPSCVSPPPPRTASQAPSFRPQPAPVLSVFGSQQVPCSLLRVCLCVCAWRLYAWVNAGNSLRATLHVFERLCMWLIVLYESLVWGLQMVLWYTRLRLYVCMLVRRIRYVCLLRLLSISLCDKHVNLFMSIASTIHTFHQ